jgi:hypothetical protein
MKSKVFVLALATAAGTAIAQNSIVSDQPGTFVDISGLAGTHAIFNGAVANDDVNNAITTTVTNSVFTSTTLRVCTNGYIQFGGATGATDYTNATIAPGTNSPVLPNTTQALFVFWDDMLLPANSGFNVYWMEGPAASFGLPAARGNVLIVQWNNVGHYNAGVAVGNATYQAQIYQNAVGNIAAQMLYPDVTFDNATFDNGVTATVGFAAGTTGGAGSASNVLYSFNTANSIPNGTVLSLMVPGGPLPPSVAGAAAPAAAQIGDTVLYTASVSPGANPTSTGISVHGDLTAVGGGSSVVFHDDGLTGDAAAGDGIYSFRYVIPAGTADGPYSVPVAVTDAQARNASAAIAASIFSAPAATDLGQIGAGAGGTEVVTTVDVDIQAGAITWLKFSIGTDVLNAGTNYMDIDTEPSGDDGAPTVGSINDTELGLYTSGSLFVATDDDDGSNWHTQLSFGDNTNARAAFGNGVAGNGRDGNLTAATYYLAAGCFNSVFNNNFDATSTSAAAGTIQVNFRTNIPGGNTGPACGAADVGGVGGVAGADNHLDNNDFVVFIDFFFNHNPIADQGSTGGAPGADGAWDNNDFVVFIDNFFTAPASCR